MTPLTFLEMYLGPGCGSMPSSRKGLVHTDGVGVGRLAAGGVDVCKKRGQFSIFILSKYRSIVCEILFLYMRRRAFRDSRVLWTRGGGVALCRGGG